MISDRTQTFQLENKHMNNRSLILLTTLLVLLVTPLLCTFVVETEQEFVTPMAGEGKVVAYLGIPYAQPPVNELRWRPTQPLASLPTEKKPNVVRATFGKACAQLPQKPFSELADTSSEDCLTLNIWRPAQNETDKLLSVMVYLHGGKLRYSGSAAYDGEYLTQRSVDLNFPAVVVTLNYRLGVFGFLGHKSLYSMDSTTGNYGLLDQITALNWIKSNIQKFGGDPQRITLFGDSAGAKSVAVHMVSKRTVTSDLFHRAIIMSGIFEPSVQITLQESFKTGETLQRALGCDTTSNVVECMQTKPVQQVLKVFNSSVIDNWLPVIDNYVLTEPIDVSFKNQRYKNVPTIIGSTSEERGEYLCDKYGDIKSYQQFTDAIKEEFPANVDAKELISFYNVTTAQTNYTQVLIQMKSDYGNHCPTRSVALELSKQIYNTFLFTYSWRLGYLSTCEGATHSSVVPPLFPSVLKYVAPGYEFTQFEQYLSNDMTRYWSYFSNSGDPNYPWPSSRRPQISRKLLQCFFWKYYNSETEYEYRCSIPREAKIRSRFYTSVCSFWDKFQ